MALNNSHRALGRARTPLLPARRAAAGAGGAAVLGSVLLGTAFTGGAAHANDLALMEDSSSSQSTSAAEQAPAADTASTSTETTAETLRRGDSGASVEQLQSALNDRGAELPVTGFFGSMTEAAVQDVQSSAGIAVDGVVGADTRAALEGGSGSVDSGSEATEVMGLGFAGSTFRFAARPGEASSAADLDGRRVATSYAGLVRSHLRAKGVDTEVVRLDGAVETAITLGVADAIADVVETGTTLRQQGLEVFGEPILRSEAVLIRRSDASESGIDVLHRRLQGVVTAREYVLLDYDCPAELVSRAVELTPGLESPTVSTLHDETWCAVRSMVPRGKTNRIMDELYELGARAILVTEITACRL